MVNVPRFLVPVLFSSMAAALFGCSGADQPPPAGDSSAELLAEEAAGTEPGALDPTHTIRQTPVDEFGHPKSVCKPREARECRWYYKDSRGQQHCPMSYQLCQLDGKDWTACGKFVLDQSGNIVPL